MKRTPSLCLWLLLIVSILPTGCTYRNSHHTTRMVTDMAGRTMQVPDTIRRIYATRPGSILMYAVAPEMIVCRSLQPGKAATPFLQQSYRDLPYSEGSPEEIMKYKPDIIISCFDINKKTKDEADRLSQQTGIPVFQVEIGMYTYPQTFDALGDLLNLHAKTDPLKSFVHQYLDTIINRAQRIPSEKKVRVYYAEGEAGFETDPSGSMHSQIIDLVGGINVAGIKTLSGIGMTPVSMEQILLWDPDVILCWTGMSATLPTYHHVTTRKIWQNLRAVREKQVWQIPFLPFGWFDRPPGTNRILGAIWTSRILYPELYPNDLEEITRRYFKLFYHYTLTGAEVQHMLHPNPDDLIDPEFMKHLKK